MLYYGDRSRAVGTRATVASITASLDRARGIDAEPREDALLCALVASGELAQALADRAFAARGHDDPDPAADAALALTVAVARWLWSCRSAPAGDRPPSNEEAARALRTLSSVELPQRLEVRVPEGYAHYAVHPALHARAAHALAGAGRPTVVVGIRSIGTSLAAMVAAATGAAHVRTVRPTGHPFHRRVAAGPGLARALRGWVEAGALFAVADEGPGLSGSSFDAVAEWLRGAGADPGRIALLPSHAGELGPAAPPDRRERWARSVRRVATFEDVVLPRLRSAAARVLGASELYDLSAGRWRAHVAGEAVPVFAQQERRKYLAVAAHGCGPFLLRFGGIGAYGEESFRRALVLGEAGFSPPAVALLHGFVAQRWVSPRAPGGHGADVRAGPSGAAAPRPLPDPARIAAYLAFRARTFPATATEGASAEQLLQMLRVNTAEALGPQLGARVSRLEEGVREIEHLPRVAVDGKLEAWEWLRLADGTTLKADATDHAFGHDLVGCQSAAWDVAAAHVELGLSWGDAVSLAARLSPGATARALSFLVCAYLAHRVGRWTYALRLEDDPGEREPIAAILRRYSLLLRAFTAARADGVTAAHRA